MLESVMEELIAKYPNDFFQRKSFILKGRQGSFAGVGRFDLLFTDEHQTNILMELKARPAKYEDASQLAKYKDALKEQGMANVLMWLVATDIPPSVREFLDRIGIEYTEIHESEYQQVAIRHNEIVFDPKESQLTDSPSASPSRPTQNKRERSPSQRSSFGMRSNISPKFRITMDKLHTFFPAGQEFLSHVSNPSSGGFWISSSTNAHLYYNDSFLAFMKVSLDSILFSPFFNGRIDGSTIDRHKLVFPDVFRRLSKDTNGQQVAWVRFSGDGSVTLTKEAPREFFTKLLDEIVIVLNNANAA